jgi:hypothetical protein
MLPDAVAAAESVRDAEDASRTARQTAEAVAELAALFQEDDLEIAIDGDAVRKDPQYKRLAELVQNDEEETALGVFETMPGLAERSGEYALLYGFLVYREGEYGPSRRALLRARGEESAQAHEAAIAYYLAKGAFDAGSFARAVDEMTRYRETSQSLSRSHPAE